MSQKVSVLLQISNYNAGNINITNSRHIRLLADNMIFHSFDKKATWHGLPISAKDKLTEVSFNLWGNISLTFK